MAIELPGPVAAYVAADAANDPALLADCFTADAVVRDESKEHKGIAEIVTWKLKTREEYQYTSEPIKVSVDGGKVQMRSLVTGNFPGSPVELDYTFTLAEGKISLLEIV